MNVICLGFFFFFFVPGPPLLRVCQVQSSGVRAGDGQTRERCPAAAASCKVRGQQDFLFLQSESVGLGLALTSLSMVSRPVHPQVKERRGWEREVKASWVSGRDGRRVPGSSLPPQPLTLKITRRSEVWEEGGDFLTSLSSQSPRSFPKLSGT